MARRNAPLPVSAGWFVVPLRRGSSTQVGECPERQRGRTVNPLAKPSQVRVLLPPPSHFPVLFHHEASGPVRRGQTQCADTWNEVDLRICLDPDHGRLLTDERRSRVKSNSGASFLAQRDAKFNIYLKCNISFSTSYSCNLRFNLSKTHYILIKAKLINRYMIRKNQKIQCRAIFPQ